MLTYKSTTTDLFHVDRVKTTNGYVHYKAVHACKILGYKNVAQTVAKWCKDDATFFHVGTGGKALYISRRDVMRLAIKSKNPAGEAFQEWLLDVAESVFDTGAYISPDITEAQAVELEKKVKIILEEFDPWVKMWSPLVLDKIREFYGKWNYQTFWWKYVYSFLTPEERLELDLKNPVDPITHQRATRVHQWLEQSVKDRLSAQVVRMHDLLLTSSSRADLETRLARIDGANQIELFD